MRRGRGFVDRRLPRPAGTDFQEPTRPLSAPAAQDPSPLTPGDVVSVYVDPWTRQKREGIAVLVKPRDATVVTPRPPLEQWEVRLDTVENAAGELLRVPRGIQYVWRVVHPDDRLALARDVAASSPPAGGEQLRLLEDEAERDRR